MNIENLTGNEEDIDDWFEAFERNCNANGWNDDIKSIKNEDVQEYLEQVIKNNFLESQNFQILLN